ncbi:MAG TPA: (2Fe-2S)-binding protein [Gemmatimonadales bacterium]|nr:(2Fe-2S)-binding protein [Gemmatimonadales bacterium]
MTKSVRILVNGTSLEVADDLSLAAALLNAGHDAFRRSVTGGPRGPVCGMGTCFECRVTVDGMPGKRACLEPVRDGMQVMLDG